MWELEPLKEHSLYITPPVVPSYVFRWNTTETPPYVKKMVERIHPSSPSPQRAKPTCVPGRRLLLPPWLIRPFKAQGYADSSRIAPLNPLERNYAINDTKALQAWLLWTETQPSKLNPSPSGWCVFQSTEEGKVQNRSLFPRLG